MINLKVSYDLKGALVNGQVDAKRDILQPALDSVGRSGLRTARELTPVRTGLARSKWYLERRGITVLLRNDLSYVPYLEYGTRHIRPYRMAQQAAKVMEKQLSAEMSKQIDKTFN